MGVIIYSLKILGRWEKSENLVLFLVQCQYEEATDGHVVLTFLQIWTIEYWCIGEESTGIWAVSAVVFISHISTIKRNLFPRLHFPLSWYSTQHKIHTVLIILRQHFRKSNLFPNIYLWIHASYFACFVIFGLVPS